MHSVDFKELVKITANLTAIKIDINDANSILPVRHFYLINLSTYYTQ